MGYDIIGIGRIDGHDAFVADGELRGLEIGVLRFIADSHHSRAHVGNLNRRSGFVSFDEYTRDGMRHHRVYMRVVAINTAHGHFAVAPVLADIEVRAHVCFRRGVDSNTAGDGAFLSVGHIAGVCSRRRRAVGGDALGGNADSVKGGSVAENVGNHGHHLLLAVGRVDCHVVENPHTLKVGRTEIERIGRLGRSHRTCGKIFQHKGVAGRYGSLGRGGLAVYECHPAGFGGVYLPVVVYARRRYSFKISAPDGEITRRSAFGLFHTVRIYGARIVAVGVETVCHGGVIIRHSGIKTRVMFQHEGDNLACTFCAVDVDEFRKIVERAVVVVPARGESHGLVRRLTHCVHERRSHVRRGCRYT